MKRILFLVLISFFLFSCSTTQEPAKTSDENTLSFDKNGDGEWEIIVLDPEYNSFLITQQPKEYYSEQTLKIKNTFYVTEWNIRYSQPFRYNPNIYEVKIDYNPDEKYGLEFEYRLYMFFKFVEKKYKVTF